MIKPFPNSSYSSLFLLRIFTLFNFTLYYYSSPVTASTARTRPNNSLGMTPNPDSTVVDGVTLPTTQTVLDQTFHRQGYGTRRFQWAGMHVRVYVAGLWTPAADDNTKLLTFTFLRTFGQQRVQAAWRYQLQTSVTSSLREYTGYERDKERFVELFGPVAKHGTQQVLLVGNETRVLEEGVEKGAIIGEDFQKAFLSVWFGETPASEELKAGLLGVCEDGE